MKFMEIFSRYSWQEIEPSYVKLYPEEKSKKRKAREAFAYIQTLSPSNTAMQIEIAYCEDEDGNYHDVCGKDGMMREDGLEEKFCLALVRWGEWLGMDIEPGVRVMYSDLDIVCHCFWEMTWNGYSMDMVIEAREELSRRALELDTVTELEWRKALDQI
jgi:hypothetical protein